MYICVYIHTYIYTYVHVCMYACMHVCMYVCTCNMYLYIQSVYTYTYIYITECTCNIPSCGVQSGLPWIGSNRLRIRHLEPYRSHKAKTSQDRRSVGFTKVSAKSHAETGPWRVKNSSKPTLHGRTSDPFSSSARTHVPHCVAR